MGVGEPDITGEIGWWTRAAWLKGWRGAMILVALCLTVYLPGFTTLPAVDRDESRFAQASRQMLESGDYVVPRVLKVERLNKPPLIYWLQATAARAFTGGDAGRDQVWMYRVPSLVGAVVAVLAAWRMGVSMFGALTGFMGAAVLAVCPVVLWEAHQARSDMVLVAFTTVALWALWESWKKFERRGAVTDFTAPVRRGLSASYLLWPAVALGVLTKGPITPMVVGLGVVALCAVTRRWRWAWTISPLLGVAIIGATLAPWLYLVAKQVGWHEYLAIIRGETVGRSLEPKEGHSGPPGYHTLLLVALMFPGSLFTGLGVVTAVRDAWRWRTTGGDTGVLFLVCVVVPSWLVFEVVRTKLPHYTMPLYPAVALLSARACCMAPKAFEAVFHRSRVIRGAMTAWLIIVPLFVLGAFFVLGLAMHRITFAGPVCVGIGLAVGFVAAAAIAIQKRDMPRLQLCGIVAFAGGTGALLAALPRLETPWISRSIAAELHRLDGANKKHVAAVGFHEDSLVFESRGRVEMIKEEDLAAWYADPQHSKDDLVIVPSELVVEDQENGKFSAYYPRGSIDGFNYTKGRWTYLTIIMKK